MKATDQKKFVRELSGRVAKDICQQIADGKIPDNWDGHELRRLLADRHKASAAISSCMNGSRLREYNNTVLVNNL